VDPGDAIRSYLPPPGQLSSIPKLKQKIQEISEPVHDSSSSLRKTVFQLN
jgi:hypothetical protein